MVCLETTFLVDFLDGVKQAVEYLGGLQDGREVIMVTAPSIFEIVEAAEVAQSEKERSAIKEFLSGTIVLPFDEDAAWVAGEISAHLVHAGRQIGERDTFIAAIARHHRQVLITRNTRHFRRVPGLEVQRY